MRFSQSSFISFGKTPVREIWLQDSLVWKLSSYAWVQKNLQSSTWSEITYGPTNTLVAAANNRYTYSIDNGDTWASPSFPFNPAGATETYNAVSWGNGMWVMLETLEYAPFGTQNFYTSFNILTGWTQNTLNKTLTSIQYSDCIYSTFHGRFIAVGDNATTIATDLIGIYSTNGIDWLSANYLDYFGNPSPNITGINGNITEGYQMPNNRLVACSDTGNCKFVYSNNGGSTWRQGGYNASTSPLGQNLQTGHNWTQVAYGYDNNTNLPLSGRYVGVCTTGSTSTYQFAYSDDGISWYGVSYSSSDLKRNWNNVVYGNGYFVALGAGNQAMSKDGINWIAFSNVPSTVGISDVTIANNRFVALKNNQAGGNNALIADFIVN